ncbi:unnamed protein product [Schistosoma margrebowiei]|uniref:Uncharacterized protein n=1 Tax=Schistosoma margrebowiei TaxID=48269 RepID=A0A183NC79_9TREM|nr:unnamed protein product [Schistosoma margrebowiei]
MKQPYHTTKKLAGKYIVNQRDRSRTKKAGQSLKFNNSGTDG